MKQDRTGEIVPLSDRMRYMRWLRLTFAVAALVAAAAVDEVHVLSLGQLGLVSAAWLGVSLAGEALWHRLRSQGLYLFGILLIVDGVYLATVTHLTGGAGSLSRYLVLAHLIAVTLLASYRTGLKLALWHSLLMLLAYNLADVGLVTRTFDGSVGAEIRQLAAFISAFWVVAIVTAAGSAGNERELRRRKYDLEALAVMARRLEADGGSLTVSDTLVRSLADVFDLPRVALLTFAGDVEVAATHGMRVASPSKGRDGSVLAEVARRRRTMLIERLDPACDPELAAAFTGARNLLVVPMIADDRTIGVVVAEHGVRHGGRASRRVVSTIERFVSHAALALRNAWLSERMHALARIDDLTRIPNRRRFEEAVEVELARHAREGGTFGLLLIDIDKFKPLNDTHGHQTGDEVLRGVAAAMDHVRRETDTLARYGGEEFVLIVPNSDAEEAVAAAERLRQAVAEADVPVPVTVSVGVALAPQHGRDAPSVVAAADRALYEAKHGGRDQVRLATAAQDTGAPATSTQTNDSHTTASTAAATNSSARYTVE